MTRIAGDGNVSNLRVTGRKSGRVFYLQARRIRSQAQARREAAIKTWITQLPYGLQQLCLSDVTELARNVDLFHCCIVDALLADAEAAGR